MVKNKTKKQRHQRFGVVNICQTKASKPFLSVRRLCAKTIVSPQSQRFCSPVVDLALSSAMCVPTLGKKDLTVVGAAVVFSVGLLLKRYVHRDRDQTTRRDIIHFACFLFTCSVVLFVACARPLIPLKMTNFEHRSWCFSGMGGESSVTPASKRKINKKLI